MSNSPLCRSLFFALFFIFSSSVSAQQPIDNKFDKQTYEIGVMVQALQIAIKSPQEQKSLLTISHYASDRRYYAMIRGWLFEELVVIEGQLYVTKNVKEKGKLQLQSDSLKKAIRVIK
jgi:hypothetical protein